MTNEEKKQIIQNELKALEREMYPLEVRARVSKKVGDQELNIKVIREMERLEKYVDGYQEELKNLENAKT